MSLLSDTLDESLKLGVTWTAVAGAVTGTRALWLGTVPFLFLLHKGANHPPGSLSCRI